jgi:hypothetical protein
MIGARHRRLVSGLLSVGVIGAILAMMVDVDPPSSGHTAASTGNTTASTASSTRCGPASAATIAGVDDFVARHIYAAERSGKEARTDVARIAGFGALLAALESSNQSAVYAAVHTIVYTPRWHIVRLRVVQHGRVLADVGGPDIIAPISGTLRLKGRIVGSFVTSVQDDLGYVKLVSRFVGVPIDLYRGGTFVMGTLKPPPPPSVSDGESLTVGGRHYRATVLAAAAFPTGALKVALFVPTPASTLAARDCAFVRVAAWGNVAHQIASRFTPLSSHYNDFRDVLQSLSGGLVFVRSGSTRLAGAGPASIPQRGAVKYRGRTWTVFSWEPTPPVRIYFLTPPG